VLIVGLIDQRLSDFVQVEFGQVKHRVRIGPARWG
jgi:hypothetical protein